MTGNQGCVWGYFQVLNGQVKIGNPSRKQISAGYLDGNIFQNIFWYGYGQVKIGNPSRKQISAE